MIIKFIKIFIASPSGLSDERHVAKTIIDEINQSHGEHWRCQFGLEGWELTLLGHNRAKSLISQDLGSVAFAKPS